MNSSSVIFSGFVVLDEVLFESDQGLYLLDIIIDLRIIKLEIGMTPQNLFLVLFLLDLLVHGQLNSSLHSLLAFFVQLFFKVLAYCRLDDLEVPLDNFFDVGLPADELIVVINNLMLSNSILIAKLVENVPHYMIFLFGICVIHMKSVRVQKVFDHIVRERSICSE